MTPEAQVESVRASLERAAVAAGVAITADGRIGESELAPLIGMESRSLANRRGLGTAPPFFRLGGRGHRVTYSLVDVAAWILAHRDCT